MALALESLEQLREQSLLHRACAKLARHSIVTRLLSFEVVVATCVVALITVAVPRTMADPDIWWHLRNAHQMVSNHSFIREDFFSFTAKGSPWIDHEWLSELPFYFGWHYAQATGVYLVTVAVIAAIFLGTFRLCWRASRSVCTSAFATVLAALLSTISFGPRTLLFGWLCLVLELVILEASARRPKLALTLPPLFLIWVNLHGSWLIGVTVLAMTITLGHLRVRGAWIQQPTFTRQHSRMLWYACVGVGPALFCNPWGWRLVAYPFNFAFKQTLNVANVLEWQPLDLHSLRGKVVLAAVALVVGKQFYRPRVWSLTELAYAALGLFSALNHSRFLFLLALLAAPVAARSFAAASEKHSAMIRPAMNAVCILAVLATMLLAFHRSARQSDSGMNQFPSTVLPILAGLDPHHRLFNEFLWGGYIGWIDPTRAVFIDSRVDIFEYNGTFADYLDIIHIRHSLELLDRYRVSYILFEKDTPLVYLLQRSGGWKADYDDGKNILLERTSDHLQLFVRPE